MKELPNEDLGFVRKAAGKGGAALPVSLSPEAITELVTGKKQKKPRRVVRAVVSAALAACLALTSAVVLHDTVIAPAALKNEIKRAGTNVSYEKVGSLIEKNRKAFRYATFGTAVKSADGMVEESAAAVNGAGFGTDDASLLSYAETNLRTEGVLESDFVKTDGRYLYLLSLSGRALFILEPDTLAEVSRITLTNENGYGWFHSPGFYLLGDRILLHYDGWNEEEERQQTDLIFFDISDRAAPRETRRLIFDGSLVSSRVIGEKLALVSASYPDQGFQKQDYTTFVPCYREGNGTPCYLPEGDLYLGGAERGDCFTTVTLLDLSSPNAEPQRVSVFGEAANLYATAETLYVYAAAYPEESVLGAVTDRAVSPVTCIQKFDLRGEKPILTASGRVEGFVRDAFAMDEYEGYLRVAAGTTESRVYVLDGDLNEVGRSEVLAPDEMIQSVRFMGAVAYVVTFRNTDPLFVLDCSDPAAPALKGEVKLPGFSAYLHPAGEGYLLGVGYGGTEEGLDGSAKLSVFDVRDPANPKESGSLTLPDTSFDTAYKAFVSLPDGGFLIPYTENVNYRAADAGDAEYYTSAAVPGMLRVAVEEGKPVLLRDLKGKLRENRWAMARASFIGDTAYLISDEYRSLCVEAFSLLTGEAGAEAYFVTEEESPAWETEPETAAEVYNAPAEDAPPQTQAPVTLSPAAAEETG